MTFERVCERYGYLFQCGVTIAMVTFLGEDIFSLADSIWREEETQNEINARGERTQHK